MCWMPGNVRFGSCSLWVWHSCACWSGGEWSSCSNGSKNSLCLCNRNERRTMSSSVVEPSHACFIPVHGVHHLSWCQWDHCGCVELFATNQDSPMSFIFTTASKINPGIQKCFPLIRNSKRRQAVISNWSTAPGFSGFFSLIQNYAVFHSKTFSPKK